MQRATETMPELSLPQVPTEAVSKLQQPFELLSKGWVLLLGAIYGTGYIVVSMYHASLGLNEINPLRPKIAAAGLLFLAFSSGAMFLAYYARSALRGDRSYLSEGQERRYRLAVGGLYLYCLDILATSGVSQIIRYDDSQQPHGSLFLSLWGLSLIISLAALFTGYSQPSQHWKGHWLLHSVCTLLAIVLISLSIPEHGKYSSRQFALYLATVQLPASTFFGISALSALNKFNIWTNVSTLLLLPFITFSLWVYPHTRAAFGGGEPTVAQMYLALPNGDKTSEQVKIVDETDNGYYVIQVTKTQVQYIPRSAVTSVVFEKPSSWF